MKRFPTPAAGGSPRAAAVIALAFFAAAAGLETPMVREAARSPWMAARRANGSPAFALVAGSFRSVAANVLWVKVDAYHHEWEEQGRDWSKNADLLPILRAITFLDPHFIEAYSLHAFLLQHQNRPRQALAMLREGIRNNPNRHELYEAAALLHARVFRETDAARAEFARALERATDPFDRQRLRRTLSRLDNNEASARKAS
jgi:tetratricopeptide (TPR) repeat protein